MIKICAWNGGHESKEEVNSLTVLEFPDAAWQPCQIMGVQSSCQKACATRHRRRGLISGFDLYSDDEIRLMFLFDVRNENVFRRVLGMSVEDKRGIFVEDDKF